MTYELVRLSGLEALRKQLAVPAIPGALGRERISSTHPPDLSWDLGVGWERSQKLASTGDMELMSAIKPAAATLRDSQGGGRRGVVRDVVGDEWDTVDYLSGNPEAARRYDGARRRKFARVVVNIGALA